MDASVATIAALRGPTGWSRRCSRRTALFAERGYAAVTMDEIAAAVGVTKPLLYNYFGNKERLYIACMERAGDALTATIAEAVADSANPGDALGAGVRAFFAFLDTDRAAWAVLFDETLPRGGEVADRVADYRGRDRRPGLRLAAGPAAAASAATPPGSKSRPSPPPCSAPPRRSPAGGCGPRRSPPSEAAELLISTIEPGLRARSAPPLPTPHDRKEQPNA